MHDQVDGMRPKKELGLQQGSNPLSLSLLTLSFWIAHKETLLPSVETSLYDPRELENRDISHANQSCKGNLRPSRQFRKVWPVCSGNAGYSSRDRWIQAFSLDCLHSTTFLLYLPVCYVADTHRTDKKSYIHSRLKQVQHPGVGTH